MENKKVIKKLKQLIGDQNVLTSEWNKLPYSKGWRYGAGSALAVLKPNKLSYIWRILQICAKENIIIIMQAANTGLTGGSTPCGNDYDRPIIVINTMLINNIHIIKEGSQIVSLTGSTLYDLEKKLKPYGREPHSIIGSTSIGASIIGGICNNAGGSLVQRGPSYTEMALYAKINKNGNLELVNELGINLGSSPEEILDNLQNQNYKESDIDEIQDSEDNINSINNLSTKLSNVDSFKKAKQDYIKERKNILKYIYFLRKVNKMNVTNICVVCMENQVTHFINPCGHTFCGKCLEKTLDIKDINNIETIHVDKKCPMFRKYINNVNPLYFL